MKLSINQRSGFVSGSGLVRIRDRVHVRVVSGSCPWFAFGLRLGSLVRVRFVYRSCLVGI